MPLRVLKHERATGEQPADAEAPRAIDNLPYAGWGASGSTTCGRASRRSLRAACRATSSTAAPGAAAPRSSCAASWRPRGRGPSGRSSPTGGGRGRRPAHACGRRSTASACSTTAWGSSRARRPTMLAEAPDRARSRCCGSGRATRRTSAAVLDATYDRLAPGGYVIVDAYGAGSRRRRRRVPCGAAASPRRSSGSTGAPPCWRNRPDTADAPRAAPPAVRPEAATQDLAVVVVVYNMRREAARTLHSLSRSLPAGDRGPRLRGDRGRERLGAGAAARRGVGASFGPEFRYIDLGDDATPSPARALNRASRAAGGATWR